MEWRGLGQPSGQIAVWLAPQGSGEEGAAVRRVRRGGGPERAAARIALLPLQRLPCIILHSEVAVPGRQAIIKQGLAREGPGERREA